jgi:adenylate cyclase
LTEPRTIDGASSQSPELSGTVIKEHFSRECRLTKRSRSATVRIDHGRVDVVDISILLKDTNQVADLIVASGTEKQLESHRREITALFCDLRGFTGFSEASAPEDVMTLLRDYHAAIGEIIIKYSGTLERYAGDGVMVVFNDPVPVDNPALRAVQMALETREAMGALTEKWRELGHDVGFGIGIAHGYATLGTIGFEGRFDYAAIGTVSNVASRLCDEAKPGQILISPRVFMAVKDAVTVEPVGEFTLKGIGRPLAAYNVLAAAPPNA